MANYLVKTYDDRGRLVDRFEFAAPNDDEAEGAVEDLAGESSLELWCGTRWVRTWPAQAAYDADASAWIADREGLHP